MTSEIKEKLNKGVWFNAKGNYFKLKTEDNKILMRLYRLCESENSVNKEFYRLDPSLIKMEEGLFDYDDFFIEPIYEGDIAYGEFEKIADKEYENGINAIKVNTSALVCPRA